jgi:multidrug resistance efflux pump
MRPENTVVVAEGDVLFQIDPVDASSELEPAGTGLRV